MLGAVAAVRRIGLPPRGAWPGILLSGVLWFGVYMVVLNWGEREVDAGTAALLVNIGPLLIALLGGTLLGEGLPRPLLAGVAVSFAGAVVVGLSTSGDGGASALGVVLCLLAAGSYAAGVVAQKPALRHAGALQVTTYGCLVGAVVCLPFTGTLLTELRTAPLGATLNMVYLGVFPTALAFTTWAFALSRTTAGRMGATTYAVPALVVLMSWALLGEVAGPARPGKRCPLPRRGRRLPAARTRRRRPGGGADAGARRGGVSAVTRGGSCPGGGAGLVCGRGRRARHPRPTTGRTRRRDREELRRHPRGSRRRG